jgi:hypothetical protein
MTKQTNETNSKSKIELAFMRLLIAVLKTSLLIMAVAAPAQAGEPRHRHHRSESKNYILRRQQVMPGLGTPTTRLIYGKREIDIYRNGLRFEKDNVVGVTTR